VARTFVRLLGDLGIKVAVEHPQGGFLMPTLARYFGAARGFDTLWSHLPYSLRIGLNMRRCEEIVDWPGPALTGWSVFWL